MCNVLMMREMDKRYKDSGMVVSALFPGCIAESPLFREKRGWFRTLFPLFQKYITKQFVTTEVSQSNGLPIGPHRESSQSVEYRVFPLSIFWTVFLVNPKSHPDDPS